MDWPWQCEGKDNSHTTSGFSAWVMGVKPLLLAEKENNGNRSTFYMLREVCVWKRVCVFTFVQGSQFTLEIPIRQHIRGVWWDITWVSFCKENLIFISTKKVCKSIMSVWDHQKKWKNETNSESWTMNYIMFIFEKMRKNSLKAIEKKSLMYLRTPRMGSVLEWRQGPKR